MKNLKKVMITTAIIAALSTPVFASDINSFSDVPADHWAYDAVAQLAKDGIIEGYGDNTFRGERLMTRYEMAQLTARAMAKIDEKHKALIDKLAAEYAYELDNLGVRVSNLEKHADNVKWTGEAKYAYRSERFGNYKHNDDQLELRLTPTIEINNKYEVKARLDAYTDMSKDKDTKNDNNIRLRHLYINDNLDNLTISAGKMPIKVDGDLIFNSDEDSFSGIQVDLKGKNNFILGAGRYSGKYSNNLYFDGEGDTANYQFFSYKYTDNKFSGGIAFHALKSDNLNTFSYSDSDEDHARIYSLNAKYIFDKNVSLSGNYAKNTSSNERNQAWQTQLNYKGADINYGSTYGIYAAYRNLGENVVFGSNFDAMKAGQKGFEIGANYVPTKNILISAKYFNGKNDSAYSKHHAKTIFSKIEFFF